MTPLIYTNKVMPAPWNNSSADGQLGWLTWPGYQQANIFFYLNGNGTSRARDHNATSTDFGTWTTTPSTQYEVNSSITTPGLVTGTSSLGNGNTVSIYATEGWVPIRAGEIGVAAVTIDAYTQAMNLFTECQFQILIRKVGTSTPVSVSSFTLVCSIQSLQ